MGGHGREAVENAGRHHYTGFVGSDGQFKRLTAGALEVLDPDRMKPGLQGNASAGGRAAVDPVVVDDPDIMDVKP